MGWNFTKALMDRTKDRITQELQEGEEIIAPYADPNVLGEALKAYVHDGDPSHADKAYNGVHLISWLRYNHTRPQPRI